MAVWLGQAGGLRFSRHSTGRFFARIAPSDVDPSLKRFGFDRPVTSLITGDSVWIRRVDEQGQPVAQPLDFVDSSGWRDGQRHSDGRWFVNVDAVGGIRLYDSWAKALAGRTPDAITLTKPAGDYRLSLQLEDAGEDCLAQTIGWELNTNRDVADISSLGEGFRQKMGTMVSGSGNIDCLFDYRLRECERGYQSAAETSVYMHQLVLRQEIGSKFTGIFLLKQSGAVPLDALIGREELERALFYRCDCVVTEVAVALNPTEAIHSKIEFVTTGEIQLLYDFTASYLLQEQSPNDKILQETDFGILLEVPA
jgi:hypothetical protein